VPPARWPSRCTRARVTQGAATNTDRRCAHRSRLWAASTSPTSALPWAMSGTFWRGIKHASPRMPLPLLAGGKLGLQLPARRPRAQSSEPLHASFGAHKAGTGACKGTARARPGVRSRPRARQRRFRSWPSGRCSGGPPASVTGAARTAASGQMHLGSASACSSPRSPLPPPPIDSTPAMAPGPLSVRTGCDRNTTHQPGAAAARSTARACPPLPRRQEHRLACATAAGTPPRRARWRCGCRRARGQRAD
jgi:hypothetical protein